MAAKKKQLTNEEAIEEMEHFADDCEAALQKLEEIVQAQRTGTAQYGQMLNDSLKEVRALRSRLAKLPKIGE